MKKAPQLALRGLAFCGGRLRACRGAPQGRAIVTTGEVQVSQSAALASSPSAFSTDSLIVYWPFGTVVHWLPFLPLPVNVVPSHALAKKPPGVELRVTYSSSLTR